MAHKVGGSSISVSLHYMGIGDSLTNVFVAHLMLRICKICKTSQKVRAVTVLDGVDCKLTFAIQLITSPFCVSVFLNYWLTLVRGSLCLLGEVERLSQDAERVPRILRSGRAPKAIDKTCLSRTAMQFPILGQIDAYKCCIQTFPQYPLNNRHIPQRLIGITLVF